jgi:rhodanese-related sulfurtransferase
MIFNNIVQPEELLTWINEKRDIQVVDITHDNLLKALKIPSIHIPVHDLMNRVSELEKKIPLVLCCRVGADSFLCMNILSKDYNMDNVFSLKSGYNGLEKLLNSNSEI